MNLAYVSPLPPQRSGIADYSAALLPYLRPYCERLVGVVERGTAVVVPPGVFDVIYDASNTAWWARECAIPLYHMGNNSTYHRTIYDLLQRFPGITVLHDGNFLPFINAVTVEAGRRAAFVRELSYATGSGGTTLAWQYLRGKVKITPEVHPMLARVCQASLGVIVHSDYLQRKVKRIAPQTPITVIPMLDMTPVKTAAYTSAESRTQLGLPVDTTLLGAFGYIAPSKRLNAILRVLVGLKVTYPQLRLVCVGQIVEGYDFMTQVAELDLQDIVHVTGYVSPTEFSLYLQSINIGLNLRYPTWGEMSATLLRLLAAAKPTLVTDVASFADLSDTIVCKIPQGVNESSVLKATLIKLIEDSAWRQTVGDAAQVYVKQNCNPATVAQQYAEFIQSTYKHVLT
jgi:glycosyltransferase involved in cell wall biosynthesis